jgi:cell division septal protein FtsQ
MINNVLEEILNVVQDLDKNIKSESNVAEFVKEARIQITTHDNIIFQLQVIYNEGDKLEKIVSVNRIKDNGEIEVFDIKDECDGLEKLREIEPLSKFLN